MLRIAVLLICLLFSLHSKASDSIEEQALPTIGNSSSSLISISEERKLGKAWLRKLRQNTKSYYNPLLNEYLENLVYKLAPNTDVQDKDFTLTVVDSPTLNAFAVPGSIIGINAGLLLYTHTEHELASVIAHELAHLSQRHFARQLEQQQQTAPLRLIGLLASAILLATANSDAGVAAYASTQALSIDGQLRFSRKNEQEADRLGMITLHQSNFDPSAMSRMFERMHNENQASSNSIPEYLSTHPLSQSRVSDTKARASQYAPRRYRENINFHFCRVMVISDYSESKQRAAANFRQYLDSDNQILRLSSTFGLAYSLLESDPVEATNLLQSLEKQLEDNIFVEITTANALRNSKLTSEAIDKLQRLLLKNPGNYAVALTLAKHYTSADKIKNAIKEYNNLSKTYPEDAYLWYELAEVYGLAGNISALHEARAEYFFLTNRIDQAIKQLRLALTKETSDLNSTRIQKRLDDFYEAKRNPLI